MVRNIAGASSIGYALLFSLAPFVGAAAHGDTLHLINEDRLTGSILRVAEGQVVFQTTYAGTLTLALDQIAGIESDLPLMVELVDGRTIQARFETSDGAQFLTTEAFREEISVSAVQRVRPIPDDSPAPTSSEVPAEESEPGRWSGAVDAGLLVNSGEKDTFDIHASATFVREAPKNTLRLKLDLAYGETESTLATQLLRHETKWQYYTRERQFYYVLAGVEHDKPRRLQVRGRAGGGVGYDVIDSEKRSLSLEGGLEFAHERWDPSGGAKKRKLGRVAPLTSYDERSTLAGDTWSAFVPTGAFPLPSGAILAKGNASQGDSVRTENDLSMRLGMRYRQTIFGASEIANEFVALPAVTALGTFRLTNEIALTTPLSNSLALKLSLLTEYDSDPGGNGVQKLDNKFLAGLSWEY